eukprot:CAMPEP_0202728196 /NCGR_PEP_ID=MMETSP1385-20130828/185505_1 /ASSEMBLY_ACC=CAM_ASM_000861 /TAXON_ID=933848 /ORGANISM="Elphidium margaritaceum" /LENGTH=492 /DNA_ID=CAMNT_0049394443 /DNA_START=17 /DNA_END=1491 /DNA_ORIENTATION=+
MAVFFASFVALQIALIHAETIDRNIQDATGDVECVDPSTPCVVNCNVDRSCYDINIRCHVNASQPCTINLYGVSAAQTSSIRSNSAPVFEVNAFGVDAVHFATIFANTRLGTECYVNVHQAQDAGWAVLGPAGFGSLLSMSCDEDACDGTNIFTHSSTRVELNALGHGAFRSVYWNKGNYAELDALAMEYRGPVFLRNCDAYNETLTHWVMALFDPYIGLGGNYAELDALAMEYRAPVFLRNCDAYNETFAYLYVFSHAGRNHGDWTIHAYGHGALRGANIDARSTIAPYNRSTPHTIKIYAPPASDVTYNALRDFTLTVNQSDVDIEVTQQQNLNFQVLAANADSVNIWCLDGGDCGSITLDCPQSNCNTIYGDEFLPTDLFSSDTCGDVPETTVAETSTTTTMTTETETSVTNPTTTTTTTTTTYYYYYYDTSTTTATTEMTAMSTPENTKDASNAGSLGGLEIFGLSGLTLAVIGAAVVIVLLLCAIVC